MRYAITERFTVRFTRNHFSAAGRVAERLMNEYYENGIVINGERHTVMEIEFRNLTRTHEGNFFAGHEYTAVFEVVVE